MLKCHFESKSEFRKSCLLQLKFGTQFTKLKKNSEICKKLENIIKTYGVKNVLLYLPLEFEVDVRPLIAKLRKSSSCNVFVPYMIDDSFVPVPFRLPIKTKKFRIKEPSFSSLKPKIELAIVPVIGIDGDNRRIGFGKGMYDRYFANLRHKPIIVFTQLKLCKTAQLLGEAHDIKADFVITY